jgi:hypothetical protein
MCNVVHSVMCKIRREKSQKSLRQGHDAELYWLETAARLSIHVIVIEMSKRSNIVPVLDYSDDGS